MEHIKRLKHFDQGDEHPENVILIYWFRPPHTLTTRETSHKASRLQTMPY